MKTFNIATASTALETLTENIATATTKRGNGIKQCINEIDTKIVELGKDGLVGKKAKASAKLSIMGDVKGKEATRAFNIAFTMVFRNMKIATEELSVAQIENLTKHGETGAVNALLNDSDYCEAVTVYLKGLKTREVTTKTFKKLPSKK